MSGLALVAYMHCILSKSHIFDPFDLGPLLQALLFSLVSVMSTFHLLDLEVYDVKTTSRRIYCMNIVAHDLS